MRDNERWPLSDLKSKYKNSRRALFHFKWPKYIAQEFQIFLLMQIMTESCVAIFTFSPIITIIIVVVVANIAT
jgi:hypothetical protein